MESANFIILALLFLCIVFFCEMRRLYNKYEKGE